MTVEVVHEYDPYEAASAHCPESGDELTITVTIHTTQANYWQDIAKADAELAKVGHHYDELFAPPDPPSWVIDGDWA